MDETINVRVYAYEELIRDSERLRVIEAMARNDMLPGSKTILAVCGYGGGTETCTEELDPKLEY